MAKRVDNRVAKIDVRRALAMRMMQGMSMSQIGAQFGASPQAVSMALSKFKAFLERAEQMPVYHEQKGLFLENAEFALLTDLLDDQKRAKASLYHTAFAYDKVANQLRLETGKATQNIDFGQLSSDQDALNLRRQTLQSELLALGVSPAPSDLTPDVPAPTI